MAFTMELSEVRRGLDLMLDWFSCFQVPSKISRTMLCRLWQHVRSIFFYALQSHREIVMHVAVELLQKRQKDAVPKKGLPPVDSFLSSVHGIKLSLQMQLQYLGRTDPWPHRQIAFAFEPSLCRIAYLILMSHVPAEVAEAEAAHSTIVRYLAFQTQDAQTSAGNSLSDLTNAMSQYRNALSGTDVFSTLNNTNGAAVANVNAQGRSCAHRLSSSAQL